MTWHNAGRLNAAGEAVDREANRGDDDVLIAEFNAALAAYNEAQAAYGVVMDQAEVDLGRVTIN